MIGISQCPVCRAYLPTERMLVRGDGFRVLVCSASCGARLVRPSSAPQSAQRLEDLYALPFPDAPSHV